MAHVAIVEPRFAPSLRELVLSASADIVILDDMTWFRPDGNAHRALLRRGDQQRAWLALPVEHAPEDRKRSIAQIAFTPDADAAFAKARKDFPPLCPIGDYHPVHTLTALEQRALETYTVIDGALIDYLERTLQMALHALGYAPRITRASTLIRANVDAPDGNGDSDDNADGSAPALRTHRLLEAVGAHVWLYMGEGPTSREVKTLAQQGVTPLPVTPNDHDTHSIIQRFWDEPLADLRAAIGPQIHQRGEEVAGSTITPTPSRSWLFSQAQSRPGG